MAEVDEVFEVFQQGFDTPNFISVRFWKFLRLGGLGGFDRVARRVVRLLPFFCGQEIWFFLQFHCFGAFYLDVVFIYNSKCKKDHAFQGVV